MSDFEKDDEQLDVEVELYALDDDGAEDVVDADVDAAEDDEVEIELEDCASEEDAAVDIDDQADAMLDDIKSDSTYALHAQTDVENFDPDEAPANAIVDSEDVVVDIEDDADAAIAVGDDVDDLPDSIEIIEEEKVQVVEEIDEATLAEKAARSRRRLRNLLIFFIVVLVIACAAIGVFVWRNNTPPDIKQTDPDAMQASKAGATLEVFQSIDSNQIPDLVSFFGKTPEEAAEASGGSIALDDLTNPITDANIPAMKFLRNGWVISKNGDVAVSISFGLDQDKKIIYTLATFDLDAYGVADAKFDELAASKIVASSILAGVGLEGSTVDSAALTIVEKPDAVTSRDTAGKEVAEFAGATNLNHAPKDWKLTETYDHTVGTSLGDNSVIRTLTIDLR